MLRTVKSPQRHTRQIPFRIDGTGTAAILEGSQHASLTDNGTGDYTITFNKAFARVPVILATPITTGVYCRIKAVSVSAVTIEVLQAADGSTATDADFHVLVNGFDVADET